MPLVSFLSRGKTVGRFRLVPAMAIDPKARIFQINYDGGCISAPRGLLEAMFGPALVKAELTQVEERSRKRHDRRRVIGGAVTSVKSTTFRIGGYVSRRYNGAAGGRPFSVEIDGHDYTVNVNGPARAFNRWASGATWAGPKAFLFVSPKGTKYGPFHGGTVG